MIRQAPTQGYRYSDGSNYCWRKTFRQLPREIQGRIICESSPMLGWAFQRRHESGDPINALAHSAALGWTLLWSLVSTLMGKRMFVQVPWRGVTQQLLLTSLENMVPRVPGHQVLSSSFPQNLILGIFPLSFLKGFIFNYVHVYLCVCMLVRVGAFKGQKY